MRESQNYSSITVRHIPWFVRCPLVNRLFDTCEVAIACTTFTEDGTPLVGVYSGRFLIPFSDYEYDIRPSLNIDCTFPSYAAHEGWGCYVDVALLSVNHKSVKSTVGGSLRMSPEGYSATITERLHAGCFVLPMEHRLTERSMSFSFNLKFGKKDFRFEK